LEVDLQLAHQQEIVEADIAQVCDEPRLVPGNIGLTGHLVLTLPFVQDWVRVVGRNTLSSTLRPESQVLFPNVLPSPFRVDVFHAITFTCQDRKTIEHICDGFRNGFDTGYRFLPKQGGSDSDTYREFRNPPASLVESEAIARTIAKEFEAGRIVGGTDQVTFLDAIVSPVRTIPKKECTVPTGEFRQIHNLSKSDRKFYSVNECISKEEFSLRYSTFDDAVRVVQKLGPGCKLSKVDVKAAFRIVPIREDQWRVATFKWKDDYYSETRLPFGLRSAPFIFESLATKIHWILENCCSINELVHYLDDFLIAGKPGSIECEQRTKLTLAVFDLLGVPVNLEKLICGVTSIVFLGIGIDTIRGIAFVPEARLKATKGLLVEWQSKETCTQRELLSLIGLLQFAAKVVKPGRTFLRRMIDVAYSVDGLKQVIDILVNVEFSEDLKWWIKYMDDWNGEALFYDPVINYVKGLGFVTPASELGLQVFTDASGKGGGGIYGNEWFTFKWTQEEISYFSIGYRELFALATAAKTFVSQLVGKTIVFRCDNSSAVDAMTGGTCKNAPLMHLVRELHYLCARNRFCILCRHIPGVLNDIADALSRDQMTRFRKLLPFASQFPIAPSRVDHPLGWQAPARKESKG
jgi:hypothetical protein